MKIKTSELTGAALNWAVAQCEGEKVELRQGAIRYVYSQFMPEPDVYDPSTDDSLGGPIIDRLRIRTEWSALWSCWLAHDLRCAGLAFPGATRLIAAMRCFVASKLGDEVDIPEELLK